MEIYWVGSNGEDPERIYFNHSDALNSDHNYLDSFDSDGLHVESYKLVDHRYTTDF
jgi:hypothetical protein